jgi:CDP-glucose 4,6-dehydratase
VEGAGIATPTLNLSGGLQRAFRRKTVFVTGHTGFKGAWLTALLSTMGANVIGYALRAEDERGLFQAADIRSMCHRHIEADIRDFHRLKLELASARPHYVFHLAAQPLVRQSYVEPRETVEVNVLGTVSILDALRISEFACSVVIVTSDKTYAHPGPGRPFREDDRLGGDDVYSGSKAAAELLVSSYRRSFFPPERIRDHGVGIATGRAGNVIGGGDWSKDRIVPDVIAALQGGVAVALRNPEAIRPWQHVLDPLAGYCLLAARLAGFGTDRPSDFCEAWNFGPLPEPPIRVSELVAQLIDVYGAGSWAPAGRVGEPAEASTLSLDSSKARSRLGWSPRWSLEQAVRRTVDWYLLQENGAAPGELQVLTASQIAEYME